MKKKVTAFVPIKLNSQRLPNKNLLPLGEHALSWYIFDTLLNVKQIDEVYVYCSDERIVNYIPEGVKFIKRDPALDGNLVKGNDIYESFIKSFDSDLYLLAHTTSPFISVEAIENALINVLSHNYDSALSVQKKQTFTWYKGEPLNYETNDIPRTQDMEPVFIETSGFYLFEREHFLMHKSRIGFNPYFQEVNDIEAIDVDEKADYDFALQIMQSSQEKRRKVTIDKT